MTLLIAGLFMLSLMGVSAVLLLHLQKQEKALQLRVSSVAAKDRPKLPAATLMRRQAKPERSATARLSGLIGFDPLRQDQYPLPWFVVLGGGVVLGRLVVLAAASLIGSLAWLLVPVVAVFTCRFFYGWVDTRRRNQLLTQFPDALSLIVRAVRVGIPVTETLRAVAHEAPEPTRTEFDRLTHQISIGTTLETALREMASRNALPEYGFFAAALALQAQTGGGLTETLETLAEIIRKRLALKERGHALSAEARLSANVLGVLPVATGGLIFLTAPDYIKILFDDPTGHIFLGGAIISLAIGMGAMRLIVSKALA